MQDLKTSEASAKTVLERDERWRKPSSLASLHLFLPIISLLHLLVHTDSVQAAIHILDTSLSGARDAHKGLFITKLNARCHIRGSGACIGLAERTEGIYVTLEVVTFQYLWAASVEVGWGQEDFLASVEASFAV